MRLAIRFADFWSGFDPESWAPLQVLRTAIDVDVDDQAPITLFGPYGRQHASHWGTKVYWTYEPWPYRPAEFDYTVSHRSSGSYRHLRFPFFADALLEDSIAGRAWTSPSLDEWVSRTQFCNFIYANPDPPERRAFFEALNSRRDVAAPGRVFRNTAPIPDGDRGVADWRVRKVGYQRSFRFTIAFENSEVEGYTSEKVTDALTAGTIPIYWGNPSISLDIATDALICGSSFASFDDLADFVVAVDDEPSMAAPFLSAARAPLAESVESVSERLVGFFELIALREKSRRARSGRAARDIVLHTERRSRVFRWLTGRAAAALRRN